MNLRIALPGCYPVALTANLAHWHREGTHHGPKSMPRLIALSFVRLGSAENPSSGRRLWVYVRGGYAWHGDIYIDRRPLAPAST